MAKLGNASRDRVAFSRTQIDIDRLSALTRGFMHVDIVLLPRDLTEANLAGKSVVVFDVLRATTSMIAALAAGVREIRLFTDISSARAARQGCAGEALLCGEQNCLPPAGFDLGNSPPAFREGLHAGRTLLMTTTNGTRAILAAKSAAELFVGALVNATAAARAAWSRALDVTLLCAGTNNQVSYEDLLGCGAVIESLSRCGSIVADSDAALMARELFASSKNNLADHLARSHGGRNIIAAGLGADIEFAARLDSLDIAAQVTGDPPTVSRVDRV